MILLLALGAIALLLTGCGASLTVYDGTENGVRYNTYELTLDCKLVERMENTATTAPNGKRYTVESYFYELFRDFGCELISATRNENVYTASYRKSVPSDGKLFGLDTAVEYKTTHTDNLFVRTYTSTAQNPFNGLRENYDAIEPLRATTVLEQLKNGAVARDEYGELVVARPSLVDAFPYLKGMSPDGLLLNYVRYGSARTQISGNMKNLGNNKAAYVFSRYFDSLDRDMTLVYRRASPLGWYIVATMAGTLTFALIMFLTRQKKKKTTLLDRFPYNPEQYRDYDSHLPTKL